MAETLSGFRATEDFVLPTPSVLRVAVVFLEFVLVVMILSFSRVESTLGLDGSARRQHPQCATNGACLASKTMGLRAAA